MLCMASLLETAGLLWTVVFIHPYIPLSLSRTQRIDIERVAYIQTRMEKLVCYGLEALLALDWLWWD